MLFRSPSSHLPRFICRSRKGRRPTAPAGSAEPAAGSAEPAAGSTEPPAGSAEAVAGSRSSSRPRLLLCRRQAAETCKARTTAPARGRREVRRDGAWSSRARHGQAPPHQGATTAANIGAQIASTEPKRGLRWACGSAFNRQARARKSAAHVFQRTPKRAEEEMTKGEVPLIGIDLGTTYSYVSVWQ